MLLNTYVNSTQNSCTAYWSGVEILAANQSVGVKLDQGPFAHNQNGGSVDTVTFSTTHGASYIVLYVSGFDSAGGTQLTCTVGSTTLTFSLLVSGDHTGQNGSAGTARLTAIYGAYAPGSLTNEVVTVTFNQNAQSGIDVCSFSGVVGSSPVGVTVVPTWGASLTTLTVNFNAVTQGSVCLVGVTSNSGNVAAGAGTNLYAHPYNNLWSMGLTNPAGIAVTASTTTGSGGFVIGGSATEGTAYVLGTVGTNYSILSKNVVPVNNLTLAITPGALANGVLASVWNRFYDVMQNPLSGAFTLQGSNWEIDAIPQFTYVSPSTWTLGLFLDLRIGVGVPNTYYLSNVANLFITHATFPEFTVDNMQDWFWMAGQVIPSVSAGFTLNIWTQLTTSGAIIPLLGSISLASVRALAISAGMPPAQANVWVPDVNCTKLIVATTSNTKNYFFCRARLYSETTAPSTSSLVPVANSTAPDTNAFGDWPLYWAGQASGTGINTGVQLNDQSGNGRNLILDGSAQLFLGPPLPTAYNNLLVVAAPGG